VPRKLLSPGRVPKRMIRALEEQKRKETKGCSGRKEEEEKRKKDTLLVADLTRINSQNLRHISPPVNDHADSGRQGPDREPREKEPPLGTA